MGLNSNSTLKLNQQISCGTLQKSLGLSASLKYQRHKIKFTQGKRKREFPLPVCFSSMFAFSLAFSVELVLKLLGFNINVQRNLISGLN